MTVYVFKKIIYGDIPEVIQKAVLFFSEGEVQIDDTGLTLNQKQKIQDYLQQCGYKLQV